jgi:hypothetical protein
VLNPLFLGLLILKRGSSVPNMQNIGKKISEALICIRNDAEFLTLLQNIVSFPCSLLSTGNLA